MIGPWMPVLSGPVRSFAFERARRQDHRRRQQEREPHRVLTAQPAPHPGHGDDAVPADAGQQREDLRGPDDDRPLVAHGRTAAGPRPPPGPALRRAHARWPGACPPRARRHAPVWPLLAACPRGSSRSAARQARDGRPPRGSRRADRHRASAAARTGPPVLTAAARRGAAGPYCGPAAPARRCCPY